jgi:hypothetical protein
MITDRALISANVSDSTGMEVSRHLANTNTIMALVFDEFGW